MPPVAARIRGGDGRQPECRFALPGGTGTPAHVRKRLPGAAGYLPAGGEGHAQVSPPPGTQPFQRHLVGVDGLLSRRTCSYVAYGALVWHAAAAAARGLAEFLPGDSLG